jgi:hypothetical protein
MENIDKLTFISHLKDEMRSNIDTMWNLINETV